jgi:hypothetical protein
MAKTKQYKSKEDRMFSDGFQKSRKIKALKESQVNDRYESFEDIDYLNTSIPSRFLSKLNSI